MNGMILTLMMSAATTPAQLPAPPTPVESPLLFVKVIGPAGMRVTFHPGAPEPKTFDAPATVGLRPGYIYRLELTLPQMPNVKLFPSLEVRGALKTKLDQAQRHPVPIVFLADELTRIDRTGAMVTKVHYIEDPALAAPIPTRPDEPLIVDLPGDADPLQEARLVGRPMVVVRLGEREPSREELLRFAVPNTILFPGEMRLPLPPVPPQVPWLHIPVYDPLVGPRITHEECLPDGGDVGPRIGIGPDGKLGGFNASDAAIEFTDDTGKRKVSISNRVCILAPRFAVLRQEIAPVGHLMVRMPGATIGSKTTVDINNKMVPGQSVGLKHPAQTISRVSPHAEVGVVRLHGLEHIKNVQIVGTSRGTRVVGIVKEPDEMQGHPFSEPVSLFKWATPREAQIGDMVTFYLRYTNHTTEFVDNLAVSDSLSGRLEYVPGSARSDREAALLVTPNEAGSVILRWELTGKLPPGGTGIVTFQARVR